LYKLYKLLIYKLSIYSLDIAEDCAEIYLLQPNFSKNRSLALVFIYYILTYYLNCFIILLLILFY